MTSIAKQLREVGALLNLDCGDNSCLFAREKTGARTNGGCQCDLVTAVVRLKLLSDRESMVRELRMIADRAVYELGSSLLRDDLTQALNRLDDFKVTK